MELERIEKIAATAGIDEEYVEPYGKFKAKIDSALAEKLKGEKDGKLVLDLRGSAVIDESEFMRAVKLYAE